MAMSGDILVVIAMACYWYLCGENRDHAKHPAVRRTAPHNSFPPLSVSIAKVMKP